MDCPYEQVGKMSCASVASDPFGYPKHTVSVGCALVKCRSCAIFFNFSFLKHAVFFGHIQVLFIVRYSIAGPCPGQTTVVVTSEIQSTINNHCGRGRAPEFFSHPEPGKMDVCPPAH